MHQLTYNPAHVESTVPNVEVGTEENPNSVTNDFIWYGGRDVRSHVVLPNKVLIGKCSVSDFDCILHFLHIQGVKGEAEFDGVSDPKKIIAEL